jgi:hypothetical protein
MAYGEGGFGERSTFLISKMSSLGSAQKFSGLSPGTLKVSLIATWPGIHDGDAETETAQMAERRNVVALMVVDVYAGVERGICGGEGVERKRDGVA